MFRFQEPLSKAFDVHKELRSFFVKLAVLLESNLLSPINEEIALESPKNLIRDHLDSSNGTVSYNFLQAQGANQRHIGPTEEENLFLIFDHRFPRARLF